MDPKTQIIKATQCDLDGRYYEALYNYINGVEKITDIIKNEPNKEKKLGFQKHMKQYLDRMEEINKIIHQFTTDVKLIKTIRIHNDDTGHTYEELFGFCFDKNVVEISIEESYLGNKFQIFNLIKFLEMAVRNSPTVKFIKVTTKVSDIDPTMQTNMFQQLSEDFSARNITIVFIYNEKQHLRKVVLNNGYIIKWDRGMDIFKRCDRQYGLGMHDYHFRKCHNCEVDIMHSNYSLIY